MIKIAVTQRVEFISAYLETRDCLDQAWSRLLEDLGILTIPIPNSLKDPVAWLKKIDIDGVIFSGGNDLCSLPGAKNTSQARDSTEKKLLNYLSTTEIPVLGVCRGMQMIHHYLGGQLIPVKNHAGAEHNIKLLGKPHEMLQAGYKSNEQVNSFHTWGISFDTLPEKLCPLADDESGQIEAFKHLRLPWWGIMWHPERKSNVQMKDRKLIEHIFKSELPL
ncbi:glutamine amidotransferase [Aliidiomarina halalkaliphila]|uniref:Glutamine amidotransferase n=1 Tax=Aliidiomarina halalkaliphila TaxID=2593535 RepID=A0A552X5C1_9GAMM|nr:gamma-glutamyl-gamma-aminobutyrate hydrolase family protein [Aliidiomarina halalkaliphila]TRW50198.1 glutamine amidotransferase [Aliidiomarina halalkaliphila]